MSSLRIGRRSRVEAPASASRKEAHFDQSGFTGSGKTHVLYQGTTLVGRNRSSKSLDFSP
jgi:hypothetical protein